MTLPSAFINLVGVPLTFNSFSWKYALSPYFLSPVFMCNSDRVLHYKYILQYVSCIPCIEILLDLHIVTVQLLLLKLFFIHFLCMTLLSACISVHHLHGWYVPGSERFGVPQTRVTDVISCYMYAVNQIKVLWDNKWS